MLPGIFVTTTTIANGLYPAFINKSAPVISAALLSDKETLFAKNSLLEAVVIMLSELKFSVIAALAIFLNLSLLAFPLIIKPIS